MNTATHFLLQAWVWPALLVAGSPAQAVGPLPSQAAMAAHVADEGPQGVFVDTTGFDDNDDTVGKVMYNNQDQNSIHIAAIYVHGENIVTQGRFELNLDIAPGEKKQLLVIMRDKKGMKAKVSVDLHFH
jgi:hypothetical protein